MGQDSCPLLHFDSRFGLYHVAVVLSFLGSQISLVVISITFVCLGLRPGGGVGMGTV